MNHLYPGNRGMKFPIAASLLVLCTILSSCSRSDNNRSTTPPLKTVIAFATLPHAALAQIAYVRGYFLREGLEVTPLLHSYGKSALDDVLKGKADFATVAETPFMLAVLGGQKISIIATIQTSSTNEAVVARRDRGIAGAADLKGKRIAATLGTTSDVFMDLFLAAYGVSRKEVTVVDLKPGEMADALAQGKVDAVSTFVPFLSKAQKKLGGEGITFSDEHVYTEAFNIVAQQQFIRRNRVQVEKVLRALVDAENYVRTNPVESQQIVADFIRTDVQELREIWPRNEFTVALDQSLLLFLEDESQWAIRERLTTVTRVPNYLEYIYPEGLMSVKPDSVRILR